MKRIELPSGKIISTDDIIYIGNVKTSYSTREVYWFFGVTWANRAHERLVYDNEETCRSDREAIKTDIFKDLQPYQNELIYE